ncbi:MAG: cellulase family glycosylhydrolase [Lachnospiraceae bacterium]|nr:cellulase family glycosylhydrolase [Lachnospiraceae bacterium]
MRIKKFMAVLMAAALALGVSGAGGIAPAQEASASSFQNLNQQGIVDAMGAGWNLGNQLESAIGGTPHETNWGNPVITENLVKAVKNQGFKSIRVPVSYLSKIGSAPNYTIDSSWLDRVQQVVDMCINNGFYVILNMHGDGYNTIEGGWLLCNGQDQETIRKKYAACWQQIANRFKDYDHHLVFESMNEEFDGTYGTPNRTYYSNINTLNQIFVDTVRKTGGNNAKRWLMLPGWNTNINYTAGDYGFVIPSDNYRSSEIPSGEKRIMVSVHYYDPWDFCDENNTAITQWGSNATDSSKVASYGDETYINDQFHLLYQKFTSKGYPVVIGEYGAPSKSHVDPVNTACRAELAYKVCAYADNYGCIPLWWDNGVTGAKGYGLFNRYNCQVTEQSIIDAIMSVYGDDIISANKSYMLKNVQSGKYMDVSGGWAVNGANVLQYESSQAKANNTWKFVSDGNGYYYIYSALGDGNTFLLDVSNNSSNNGTNIGIWENTYCDAQKFKLVKNSNGSYSIYTKASGCKSVVEVENADTSNGANIQQWEYNGHNCQRWYLEEVH